MIMVMKRTTYGTRNFVYLKLKFYIAQTNNKKTVLILVMGLESNSLTPTIDIKPTVKGYRNGYINLT